MAREVIPALPVPQSPFPNPDPGERPLHVLHVTPYYPPTWAYGGIPRVVSGLARAQAAAGARVSVWTTDVLDGEGRSGRRGSYEEEGVTVHVSPVASNRLAWRHQLFLPLGRPPFEGSGWEGAGRVDLVHLHAHRHLLNHLASTGALRRGIPQVHSPNGTLPRIERKVTAKAAWDALFDGEVPRRAARLFATSRAEVRQLLQAGHPSEKIRILPNGLFLPEFSSLPERGRFRAKHGLGDGPLVSYLGQVTPRKGVDVLLAAFSGKALDPARLVVAGPARGMASAPTMPPGAIRFDTLSGEERLSLLVDTDVLVYASTAEVFGLVPFEGLLCGTPAVVGDDCGCGELVAEAGAGRLVPHGDVAALRAAIRGLLGSPALRREMVERGRRYVRERLDFEVVARLSLGFYREILEGTG